MSLPYRSLYATVYYHTPLSEAVCLARTTQRRLGLSRLALTRGETVAVSMYDALRTPVSDDILTAMLRLRVCERTCG